MVSIRLNHLHKQILIIRIPAKRLVVSQHVQRMQPILWILRGDIVSGFDKHDGRPRIDAVIPVWQLPF